MAQANPAGELYCPNCETTFTSGDRCPTDNTRLVRISKSGDQLIGRELDGRYTIVEKLGQGGMGTVYRGTQHSVGREVAIKVVTPSLFSDGIVIKRFLREAKLASRLSHPNAVSVLDFGQTEDGLFYLVMELVAGRTLDKVVEADRVLTPARVVRIGAQICDALEDAHQLQIIHRDLKPANVIVLSTGRDLVKVLDFGLAKSLARDDVPSVTMTNAGALVGTPAFMPPELVTGGDCDGRADLYSLGCVLHYAASGALPFTAGSVHELIAMHAHEPPPALQGVPAPLARVIAKLLAKDPDDRYPSASATREALEASLGGRPVEDEPVDPTLVGGNSTVLGWAGSSSAPPPSAPSIPAAPSPSRPVAVNAASMSPIEAEMIASSPTLLATVDELVVTPPNPVPRSPAISPMTAQVIPAAPANRRSLMISLGAMFAALVGGVVAYLVISSTSDQPSAPVAPAPAAVAPAPAVTPAPTPPPAPAAVAVPAPAPNSPVEPTVVETKPAAVAKPPPVIKRPAKPVATKSATKPVTKPAAKPAPHYAPAHTPGPVRVNPGVM